MPSTPARSSSPIAAVAAVVAMALLAAGCGDSDTGTASSVTDTTIDVQVDDATDAPAGAQVDDETVTGTEATAAAGDGPAAGDGFATPEEIAALCPPEAAPDRLVLSAWAGQQERVGDVVAGFTDITGVEIEWLENGTGDRLTKLNAERGAPTIDVALIPVNEVPALLSNGVVEPADASIPNYDVLVDAARLDGGYGSSILQFGIAYNPEFVDPAPTSWADLLDPAWAGRVAIPAMPNSGGYAMLKMLAETEGGDERDLSGAVDAIAGISDDIAIIFPFAPAMEPNIAAGEVWIYPDIAGVVQDFKLNRDVPVEVVIPDEGGPVGLNVLVTPAGNDDLSCAKSFVSWMMGPEVQTAWAETLYYGPVTPVELPAELAPFVYPQDPETVVEVDWDVISETQAEVLDQWNREVVG